MTVKLVKEITSRKSKSQRKRFVPWVPEVIFSNREHILSYPVNCT